MLLDASCELWAGEIGASPLDEVIDQLASVVQRHLAFGDHVGLGVISSRPLAWVPPETGVSQMSRLRSALLKATQLWDSDRSGYAEPDVARVVLEHMRRLQPDAVVQVVPSHVEEIARAASSIQGRFEFDIPDVFGPTPRDRILRQYASMFGLTSAPRLESERWLSDGQLLAALERCIADRPTRIIVCTTVPNTRLLEGIARLRRTLAHHRIQMSWLRINAAAGLPKVSLPIQQAINDAICLRGASSQPRFETQLKRLGIRIERTPKIRRWLHRGESS